MASIYLRIPPGEYFLGALHCQGYERDHKMIGSLIKDERIKHHVAFHLGLHCLPRNTFKGFWSLTLYHIETPFNTFANRADPDQAALIRAA